MLFEVFQRLPLREVIRKLLQVPQPKLAILPVDKPLTFHTVKIGALLVPGNAILQSLVLAA